MGRNGKNGSEYLYRKMLKPVNIELKKTYFHHKICMHLSMTTEQLKRTS